MRSRESLTKRSRSIHIRSGGVTAIGSVHSTDLVDEHSFRWANRKIFVRIFTYHLRANRR